MISSRREIVDSILAATRQTRAQVGPIVEDMLNLTLTEINDPGWAFTKNYNHVWSWLKQKTTFNTTANQEDYILAREIDRISMMRQVESPRKLIYVTDEEFYRAEPNPERTGNPELYRVWENEGVATRLAVADTINVVSDSLSDAGSDSYTVTVLGYSGGLLTSEVFTLNGTTRQDGSVSFDAREIYISKRAATNGIITVTEDSGSTTLLTMGKEERNPRFKVVSLFPIPSAEITIYVDYYVSIRQLANDSDVPNMPSKWHWVVRQGTLAKLLVEYLKDPILGPLAQSYYKAGVRAMVASDSIEPDLIQHLSPSADSFPFIRQRRSEDVIA